MSEQGQLGDPEDREATTLLLQGIHNWTNQLWLFSALVSLCLKLKFQEEKSAWPWLGHVLPTPRKENRSACSGGKTDIDPQRRCRCLTLQGDLHTGQAKATGVYHSAEAVSMPAQGLAQAGSSVNTCCYWVFTSPPVRQQFQTSKLQCNNTS